MNSVIEQLLTRRTHRSFSKEPITKEHLHLIQPLSASVARLANTRSLTRSHAPAW